RTRTLPTNYSTTPDSCVVPNTRRDSWPEIPVPHYPRAAIPSTSMNPDTKPEPRNVNTRYQTTGAMWMEKMRRRNLIPRQRLKSLIMMRRRVRQAMKIRMKRSLRRIVRIVKRRNQRPRLPLNFRMMKNGIVNLIPLILIMKRRIPSIRSIWSNSQKLLKSRTTGKRWREKMRRRVILTMSIRLTLMRTRREVKRKSLITRLLLNSRLMRRRRKRRRESQLDSGVASLEISLRSFVSLLLSCSPRSKLLWSRCSCKRISSPIPRLLWKCQMRKRSRRRWIRSPISRPRLKNRRIQMKQRRGS
ncbi:hypothetical protein PENTCL1PPCAC_867, partial [Pristionchus entomophagus]